MAVFILCRGLRLTSAIDYRLAASGERALSAQVPLAARPRRDGPFTTRWIVRPPCGARTAGGVTLGIPTEAHPPGEARRSEEEDPVRFSSIAGCVFLSFSFGGVLAAQDAQQQPPADPAKPAASAVTAPVAPAQAPAAPVAAVPAAEATPQKLILKEGADVSLKFAQDLSSKTAEDDDPVSLVLDQDIKIGDVVVVKAGAKAVGTITHAKKAGMMGKAGELNMRLDYLITDTGRLRLRGTKGKEGEGKTGTAVALTVLFGPIGLIKHGKNVEIKEGTPLLAYTDESYEFPSPK